MNTTQDGDFIDLSREDDALLPPYLNEEFLGFRLSVSERRCSEARQSVAARNVYVVRSLSRSNDYDPDRKSLSWHTAFFTDEGILDAEELMMYNRGIEKAEILASQKTSFSEYGEKPEAMKVGSRSYSMPRVPSKRAATGESVTVDKKPRSWLSTGVRSSSSTSSGSVKNMFKTSISFLKKKVVSASSASQSSVKAPSNSSSTKSKRNVIRALKMPTSSNDQMSPVSPSTAPYKEATKLSSAGRKISSSTPTKNTMLHTPSSRPSGLRFPSVRFGFFDLEQRSSLDDITFHTAPESTPRESIKTHGESMEPATISSATRSMKKLKGSVLSPVPYLPTPQSDKENIFNSEAGVDGVTKHLSSINLNTDLVMNDHPQGKTGGALHLCLNDNSPTPPSKRAALTSANQRTPLSAYNRGLYSCTSSRY